MNRWRKGFWAFVFLGLLVMSGPAAANNVSFANGSLTDQSAGADTFDLEFDISWDNSWRDDTLGNWDSVWVFAKFSTDSGATWSHATLLNTGSVAPPGSTVTFGDTGGVYTGAFIYRSAAGSGSNSWTDAQIRWDYGADGVGDTDAVDIRLFGVEMVYIPQGSFYVGDTDNDRRDNFYDGGVPRDAFQITSEGAITVADTAGNLYYDNDDAFPGDQSGPIPADFPKGYDAFYVMKYEASQGQYKDFLNLLTRTQQNNRTASQTANVYAMTADAGVDERSGIRNPAVVGAGVITFGNDFSNDGTFDESDDGADIAVNYVDYPDMAAYCDWAALRPFTELEFEKAGRGNQAAVDDEWPWGNTTLEAATTSVSNAGTATEVPNQGNLNYSDASPNGPFRVGSFADATSTRTNAGAGYYGVMELGGNLWERAVTVGHADGRAFTGTHGDGILSSDGYATNADWPGHAAGEVTGVDGIGFRGGGADNGSSYSMLADRNFSAFGLAGRFYDLGIRCARTAP